MDIIGWIRLGDKASCGGTVAEASQVEISYGKGYSFQGAKMSCRKNCVISEGYQQSVLTNGKCKVVHGMVTSNNCPLQSTLNGTDGVGSGGDDAAAAPPSPPAAFAPDGAGGWKGIVPPPAEHQEAFDEYFIVTDENTVTPARNRKYRIVLDTNTVLEGVTDAEGRTQYISSDVRKPVSIEVAAANQMQAD